MVTMPKMMKAGFGSNDMNRDGLSLLLASQRIIVLLQSPFAHLSKSLKATVGI